MVQFLANGLLAGAIYSVAGLAFLLSFRVCNRFDLSLAAIIAFGPYVVLAASPALGLTGSIILAVLTASLLGLFLERFVYRYIWRRYEADLPSLLASLGIYAIMQNLLSVKFGDNRLSIRQWPVQEGIPVWGANVTSIQIGTIVCSVVVFAIIWYFLGFFRKGREMRAVANNRALAFEIGLPINGITNWAVVTELLSGIDSRYSHSS